MGITQIEYAELITEQGRKYIEECARFYEKFKWDFYCHFTFTINDVLDYKKGWKCVKKSGIKRINKYYAIRMFKRFRTRICKELFGNHFERKGLGLNYVIGIEHEKTNLHLHGIIGNSLGLDLNKIICRMCLKAMWELIGKYTGMCRIENFDYARYKASGSIFYLAKHQIKSSDIIDFFTFGKFKISEIPGWLKYNKQYIKIDDYLVFTKKASPGWSIQERLKGWSLDLVSQVYCKEYCKRLHILMSSRAKGDGMTGDGETCDSGEQGEQKSLFPQSPDSQSPRIE